MDFLDFIIVAATGYLLGAIPFAVIIARFCGVNIFKVGSGNPGATNVKRSCGKWAGNICFILDAAKGFLATFWVFHSEFFGIQLSDPQSLCYVGLVSAIIGHSFSVFIKFSGNFNRRATCGHVGGYSNSAYRMAGCFLFDPLRFFGFHCYGYINASGCGILVRVPRGACLSLFGYCGCHNI